MGLNLLIGIETQNPIALGFIDGGVLLGGEAFPVFDEDFGAVGLGDFYGAVGRVRVDDDDLAATIGDERLNASESARKVSFFVMGDEDDREQHGEENIAF